MTDRDHPDLPVSHQCVLLGLPRSAFFHVADPLSDKDIEIMVLIGRRHLERPFNGSRRIRCWFVKCIRSTVNGYSA